VVIRPDELRPALRFLEETSERSGLFVVISSNDDTVVNLELGVTGLYFLIAIISFPIHQPVNQRPQAVTVQGTQP
jgi:hypothetical protein